MTENEAIEYIKKIYFNTNQSDECIALKMSISALIKIQQYSAIGTADECRKATEKREPKKVNNRRYIRSYGLQPHTIIGDCPVCRRKGLLSADTDYCNACGQKLDWSADVEGGI